MEPKSPFTPGVPGIDFSRQVVEPQFRTGVCPGCSRHVAAGQHPDAKAFVAYCVCGKEVVLDK